MAPKSSSASMVSVVITGRRMKSPVAPPVPSARMLEHHGAARDHADLPVGDDALAGFDAPPEHHLAVALGSDLDLPDLGARVAAHDQDEGPLLPLLHRGGGDDHRLPDGPERHDHVDELPGPEAPLPVVVGGLEQD